MISAIALAFSLIQLKHNDNILSLHKIIKKPLLLKQSPTARAHPNLETLFKTFPINEPLPKLTNKWNQAELNYFDSQLNRAHRKKELMLIKKKVYYKNVILFVQQMQNVINFWRAALVKANIAISFYSFTLKWYTLELSDFDCDTLNNNPGVKSWINMLSNRFNVSTNIALDLLTDKIYLLDDVRAWCPLAKYIRVIMRNGIGCNIVDVIINFFLLIVILYQSLEFLYYHQPKQQEPPTLFIPLKKSKRFCTKWWLCQ